jgi:NhaP-type Na+/H+ or K+/H+ antiporter
MMWMRIPGQLILFLFLPPLIYEGSAYTNVYKFSKHFLSGLLLAGPGVVLQTFLIGLGARYIFPYGWNWTESLLFGGILSATDPIAVIALLKELGSLPDLRVLIEAESILNDGTAIVAYQLCYLVLTRPPAAPAAYAAEAAHLCLGGPLVGAAMGAGTMLLLSRLHNPLLETTVTISAAYLTFFVAQARGAPPPPPPPPPGAPTPPPPPPTPPPPPSPLLPFAIIALTPGPFAESIAWLL